MKNKIRENKKKKSRCIISGKLLNGKEAVCLKHIDIYVEKQACKYETIQIARKLARKAK